MLVITKINLPVHPEGCSQVASMDHSVHAKQSADTGDPEMDKPQSWVILLSNFSVVWITAA